MNKIIILGIISIAVLSLPACTFETATSPIASTTTPLNNYENQVKTDLLLPVPFEQPSLPSGNQTPEAPDDLVFTPGGTAYRANVHGAGFPDKWPSIPISLVTLGSGKDALIVTYREEIDIKPGEAKFNLIGAHSGGEYNPDNKVELYYDSLPEGFRLSYHNEGGRPGMKQLALKIAVSSEVPVGNFSFNFFVRFNGKYYDGIKCRINVVK